MEKVILVDKKDRPVGVAEKKEAHEKGSLHRAFSIFVFNNKGEILLQKRANNKYHSGGLWSNTCCSHPRPGEKLLDAVHRRLKEEMGFDCDLKRVFTFIYRKEFKNDLVEYEYDHVLFGFFKGRPSPDLREVGSWRWTSLERLKKEIRETPELFTFWFKECLRKRSSFFNYSIFLF